LGVIHIDEKRARPASRLQHLPQDGEIVGDDWHAGLGGFRSRQPKLSAPGWEDEHVERRKEIPDASGGSPRRGAGRSGAAQRRRERDEGFALRSLPAKARRQLGSSASTRTAAERFFSGCSRATQPSRAAPAGSPKLPRAASRESALSREAKP
jgi:hypothetical protein